jgi:hypothetical protein
VGGVVFTEPAEVAAAARVKDTRLRRPALTNSNLVERLHITISWHGREKHEPNAASGGEGVTVDGGVAKGEVGDDLGPWRSRFDLAAETDRQRLARAVRVDELNTFLAVGVFARGKAGPRDRRSPIGVPNDVRRDTRAPRA